MARRLALLLSFVVVLTALAAPTSQGRRTTGASSLTFVLTGHGWGHGVGMPQYGAYGYAQHGFGYARILAHYFPGTTLGPAPMAKVRVLLGQGRKSVVVSSPVAFKVKDGSGSTWTLDPGKITLGTGLKLKVEPDKPARALSAPVVFSPGGQPLSLDDKRRYRGSFQINLVSGKLQVVNVVSLEAYLYGVVPAEMPHTWAAEALKCQAIAARSYALAVRKTGGSFDLFPDTRSQMYLGVDHEFPESNAAVDATAGQVVLYGGNVATTYFYSSSGGRTAAISDAWPNARPVPYLVSVTDPYDTISPYHNWGPFTFTGAKLARVLKVPGQLVDLQAVVNTSGRVATLNATGTRGQVSVDATTVRRVLGLRSTWFTLGALGLQPPTGPPVVYGARVRLDGVARGFGAVALEHRVGTAPWTSDGLVTPKDGTLSIVAKPLQVTQYRLRAGKVASPAVPVAVAPFVRLSQTQDPTTLGGVVRPLLTGRTVAVQRQDGPTWRTVATAAIDASGAFQAKLQLTAGTYRARIGAGRGFAAGTSALLKVIST
jgi:stage II sporulation protein D